MKKISAYEVKSINPIENKNDQQRNTEREKEAVRYWSGVVVQILAANPNWGFNGMGQQEDYTHQLMLGARESRLVDTDVERGLKNMRANPVKFMPSVGEFITLCKSASETAGLTHNTQAYTNDWTGESKKLDYKRSAEQKEKAKAHISGLKALFKK